MKVTTENNVENFVLYEINSVYLLFNDEVEVELNNIIEYDFDFDKIECSTIELLNELNNSEIENRFGARKNNHITFIHIEATGVCLGEDCGKDVKVFYDIPCDMKIRRLRVNGNKDCICNMFISLEGFVK